MLHDQYMYSTIILDDHAMTEGIEKDLVQPVIKPLVDAAFWRKVPLWSLLRNIISSMNECIGRLMPIRRFQTTAFQGRITMMIQVRSHKMTSPISKLSNLKLLFQRS